MIKVSSKNQNKVHFEERFLEIIHFNIIPFQCGTCKKTFANIFWLTSYLKFNGNMFLPKNFLKLKYSDC